MTQHKTWWILFWSPEGRPIARVRATDAKKAISKTPHPYADYLGEVYAQSYADYEANGGTMQDNSLRWIPVIE